MRTAVIKIGALNGDKYPVRLYLDDGSASWEQRIRAESSIDRSLTIANPVDDPHSTGTPLDEASVTKIFSSAGQIDGLRLSAIGKFLYRLLFQDEVKNEWESWRKLYPGERSGTEGLRTILDIEVQNLRALPWELIGEGPTSLFLDMANPFSRGRINFKAYSSPHMWPLRVLIIVGSPENDEPIDAEIEVESIAGALRALGRTIEVDILRRRPMSDIVEKYQNLQPHIIHFIGHGVLDGNQPRLRLYLDSGGYDDWTVTEIANLGNTLWAASFAFINACRSGAIDAAGAWGIADAFMSARIPAVLSMLGDIREEAAQTFARRVYQALVTKDQHGSPKPLDQVVAEARLEVSSNKITGLETNQWALASLHLTVPPEKVLAFDETIIGQHERERIINDQEFGNLYAFVDRVDQRLAIYKAIDPRSANVSAKNLLMVTGGEKVGKTAVVQMCLECCAMRGRRFSWVDLTKAGGASTILDVLRSIRDGDPSLESIISPSLDEQGAFNHFNWALQQQLLSSKKHEDYDPSKRYIENKESRQINYLRNREGLPGLFSFFRSALEKAAGDAPLILALDNVRISPDEDFNKVLIPLLISPIKKGEVKNVKLILVPHQSYKYPELGYCDSVPVSRFEKQDFVYLALEFFRYQKNHSDAEVFQSERQLVKRIASAATYGNKPWRPEVLQTVFKMVKELSADGA